MRKRLSLLVFIIIILHFLIACSDTAIPSGSLEEITAKEAAYEVLLTQFFDDAAVSDEVRERFAEAVDGNAEAQKWIDDYEGDGLNWSIRNAVFPYSNGNHPYTEEESKYHIGMLYYEGDDYVGFIQDKAKAFEWFRLSADLGSSDGAVWAGDMARYGDGITADEQAAFDFYIQAADIRPDAVASERLGDCYNEGIGTVADRKKAFGHYLDSALMGYAPALYKLSDFAGEADMDLSALYKAASTSDYSGGYWAIAYGGLDDYSASQSKQDLINQLSELWMSGNDDSALHMQAALNSDDNFSGAFVEALIRTVYSYSYHVFANENGLRPNRDYEDAQNIRFAPLDNLAPEDGYWEGTAERYLEYEECEFYEYDFDGCGENEIGIPAHSGSGGAFMGDGFAIFKQTEEGLVFYANGPECSLRDAMHKIQYDGKIYFLINWFDDTGNTPHDITAYTIDTDGKQYYLHINCKDYALRQVIQYPDPAYVTGYDELISEIEQEGHEAVAAFKQQQIYSPDQEVQLSYSPEADNLWSGMVNIGEAGVQNVFAVADIDNNGTEQVIHKGNLIIQSKYYDDFHWFQIYDDRTAFDNGMDSLQSPEFTDDFYGLHSGGNIYDLLPVGNHVVQFWTHEHEGITYCVTLQKHGMLYVLQAYHVQNGEAGLVSKSLFLDEPQGVDVRFS